MLKISRLRTFEEEQDVSLEKFFAIKVDKKCISQLVKAVSKYTKKYSHLKIVKERKYILLGTELNDKIIDKYKKYEIFEIYLPKNKPITKKQFLKSNSIWPCYYFPQKEFKSVSIDICSIFYNFMVRKDNLKVFCSGFCIIYNATTKKVIAFESDSINFMGHSVMKAVERVSISKRGYLCTGLVAFLFYEPCIACAMCLIHGRIKDVYLIHYLNKKHAPYSDMKFCYNKNLNHNYNVYQMIWT